MADSSISLQTVCCYLPAIGRQCSQAKSHLDIYSSQSAEGKLEAVCQVLISLRACACATPECILRIERVVCTTRGTMSPHRIEGQLGTKPVVVARTYVLALAIAAATVQA